MSDTPFDPIAAPGSRLDDLLSRWARLRRLDARRAAAIREAAAKTADLGFDWWWRLLDPQYGSACRWRTERAMTAVPRPWPSASAAWCIDDLSESAPWAADVPEYQPYLRLA